jgi:creatinine amidohydrolase
MELLRPEELLAAQQECPLVYVPLGPLEWHSLHLPLGTDPLNAAAVAKAAALRTGGVVFPTLFWGTERERPPEKLRNLGLPEDAYIVGMDFPGNIMPSLYATEEAFALVVRAALEQLVRLGYRLIVLVNGHGARNQVEVLKRLSLEFSARTPVRVVSALALSQTVLGIAGHAEATETSLMMALHPESVDVNRLPPLPQSIPLSSGIVDAVSFAGRPTPNHTLPPEADPRRAASARRGERYLEQTITELVQMVQKELANNAAGNEHPPAGMIK